MMQPAFSAMPKQLRAIPRWVVWRDKKVPYNATASNSKASVTDPDTWASFDQAETAYEEGGYLGVGFVLNGDGIVGVDLDKCVNSGEPQAPALDLLKQIGCEYIELSPSGTGLRGFGYGDNITGKRGQLNGINVELYSSGRYLTVTGQTLVDGPLVRLPGFAEIACAISPPDLQKRTEDVRSNLLYSSVGIPPQAIPTQAGQRNRCLFELVRYIKGTNPNATKQELRVIAQGWHEMALPVIGTKDFTTTWADFLHGWEKVRHPFGSTMENIIASIDEGLPLPEGIGSLGYGDRVQYLVRLCIALQAHHGTEPFFISARQAGEAMGLHFTDASKTLSALVADGVLTLVTKGAGKVASRYRFAWSNQAPTFTPTN